jgi:hypothetical protein
MATKETTTTAGDLPPKIDRRCTYYTPSSTINLTPDIKVSGRDGYSDWLIGTPEAFAAAGVLRLDLFPGQPGRTKRAATYRPDNASPVSGEEYWQVPGFVQVWQYREEEFRVRLVVSRAERARRAIAKQKVKVEWKNEAQVLLRQIPPDVLSWVEAVIKEYGAQRVQHLLEKHPAWAAANEAPRAAAVLLTAVKMYRLAEVIRVYGQNPKRFQWACELIAQCHPDHPGRARSVAQAVRTSKPTHLRLVWSRDSTALAAP